MRYDCRTWTYRRTPAETSAEKLAWFTEFFKFMQVKYGGRWMAYLLRIPHQKFLIEDPEDMAKKLAGR